MPSLPPQQDNSDSFKDFSEKLREFKEKEKPKIQNAKQNIKAEKVIEFQQFSQMLSTKKNLNQNETSKEVKSTEGKRKKERKKKKIFFFIFI